MSPNPPGHRRPPMHSADPVPHIGQALEQAVHSFLPSSDPASPAFTVLRFYASRPVPERIAFIEQLTEAITQSPFISITIKRNKI